MGQPGALLQRGGVKVVEPAVSTCRPQTRLRFNSKLHRAALISLPVSSHFTRIPSRPR